MYLPAAAAAVTMAITCTPIGRCSWRPQLSVQSSRYGHLFGCSQAISRMHLVAAPCTHHMPSVPLHARLFLSVSLCRRTEAYHHEPPLAWRCSPASCWLGRTICTVLCAQGVSCNSSTVAIGLKLPALLSSNTFIAIQQHAATHSRAAAQHLQQQRTY